MPHLRFNQTITMRDRNSDMTKIDIKRRHDLGYAKAHDVTDELARELSERFDAECHWDGSELKFARSGASGRVQVSDDEIRIEVRLGLLLSPLKGKMESAIDERLDRLLTA